MSHRPTWVACVAAVIPISLPGRARLDLPRGPARGSTAEVISKGSHALLPRQCGSRFWSRNPETVAEHHSHIGHAGSVAGGGKAMKRKAVLLATILALTLSASLVHAQAGTMMLGIFGGIHKPTGDYSNGTKTGFL